MTKYDLEDYSFLGSEPLNLTYVRQVQYLQEAGRGEDVNVPRLVRMLHFCVNEGVDPSPVVGVLKIYFDSEELLAYCRELGLWKDACRMLENLVGEAEV